MTINDKTGLDSKLRDISVMYELVSSIGTSLDIQVELRTFLQKLLKRFGYSVGSILLKDKEDSFVVMLTSGYLSEIKPLEKQYTGSRYGIAELMEHQAPLVKNVLTAEDKKLIISPELSLRANSLAFIPILFEGELLGLVRLFAFSENAFPEKSIRMMLPLVNRLGKAINHIAAVEKLKQTQKSLKQQKEFTETALNAQTDTFFVFDPRDGRAVRWNKTFSEVSGYSDEEIAGMKAPDDWYSAEDARQAKEVMKRIATEGHARIEMSLITKSGRAVPTEYHASLVKDSSGDAVEYIIALGRDISDRKQSELEKQNLEAELRQAHKMEAIGTLAGGIAHDFNNILAIILGYSEIVRDDLPRGSPVLKEIEEVLRATHRAKDLVKQILAFSRKSDEDRHTLQIQGLVKEVLNLLRATIPSTIEIKKNISSDCGNVLADATQIHQVLMNLCSNAAQAMDENGGVLRIDLNEVELTRKDLRNEPERRPGKYVHLTVSDTGSGIDSSIIDRIFDPYFTTKGVGKGSGMGLAVVLGIVKSHEGIITVDSSPGAGTTFHVYFPSIPTVDTTPPIVPSNLPHGTERVLFVDDEECLVGLGEKYLQRLGYQVTGKTNSVEALEAIRANPGDFDIVVTDQTMPQMTGDELARQIMNIRPDMPVILCTGFSSKIDPEKAAAIGIKEFIMKPVNSINLGSILRKVLDGDSD